MHWFTAIRWSHEETFASPRKPRKFRKAARNVSCVASRASSSRPNIPKASAKMRRSHRCTISPNASGSPVKARSTICSSLVIVSIRFAFAPASEATSNAAHLHVRRFFRRSLRGASRKSMARIRGKRGILTCTRSLFRSRRDRDHQCYSNHFSN